MRPVRRAGWVGAASGAPAAESYVGWVYMRRRGAQAFLFPPSHACCPRKAGKPLGGGSERATHPKCRRDKGR